jgi:hypothetical protein
MTDLPMGVLCDRARSAAWRGRTRKYRIRTQRIDGPLGRPVDQVSEAAVARCDLGFA